MNLQIKKIVNIDKIKSQYSREGYVVVKKLLNDMDICKIKADIELLIDKNSKQADKRQINKVEGNIINSLHNLKNWYWARKLQNNAVLKKLISNLLNEKIDNFGAELFAKPAKVGLAVPPHQDNYYWCLNSHNALTVWVALDKSNETNGGIYYYCRSHELGLLEHLPSNVPGSSQRLRYLKPMSMFKKITPKLNAGDCLIHNCAIVHGSNSNKSSNSRKGLTVRYKAKSAKVDKFMQKRYEYELGKQIHKRSKK